MIFVQMHTNASGCAAPLQSGLSAAIPGTSHACQMFELSGFIHAPSVWCVNLLGLCMHMGPLINASVLQVYRHGGGEGLIRKIHRKWYYRHLRALLCALNQMVLSASFLVRPLNHAAVCRWRVIKGMYYGAFTSPMYARV
jgi:hypothetical protein